MTIQYETPFQKIQDACKTTGLSMYYLRNGCKAGTVPHVKSGSTYYINIPALLRSLGALEGEGEPQEPGDTQPPPAPQGKKKGRCGAATPQRHMKHSL